MSKKEFIVTCPACDCNFPVEFEQLEIYCPECGYEIDWEVDRHWIKEDLREVEFKRGVSK